MHQLCIFSIFLLCLPYIEKFALGIPHAFDTSVNKYVHIAYIMTGSSSSSSSATHTSLNFHIGIVAADNQTEIACARHKVTSRPDKDFLLPPKKNTQTTTTDRQRRREMFLLYATPPAAPLQTTTNSVTVKLSYVILYILLRDFLKPRPMKQLSSQQ